MIEEDIVEFFAGYSMVPGSIKIEKGDGDRITGFGAVVFKSESEAQRAIDER